MIELNLRREVYKMPQLEEELKNLILDRYKSIREFTTKIDMPYSTMDSVLKRGVNKANITNIIKICRELNIDTEKLADGKIVSTDQSNKPPKKGVKIPVLGKVPAGVPIEAVEDIIDYEEIPEEMAKDGEFFGLQIKGNSMEPRICEGDVVIVRKQDDAETGDLVVAMINGNEATCKRLMKYKDGIRLMPNNPAYEPLYFSNKEIEEKPVKIIGKVVENRQKY